MTALALAIALVSLVVALVTLAALLEMYVTITALQEGSDAKKTGRRGVVLLEEHTKNLIARPVSDIGLTIPSGKPSWYVVFLSPNCGACNAVADFLAARPPDMLSVVVLGTDAKSGQRWLASKGVAPDRFVVPDPVTFERARILISPSVLVVIEDEMAFLAGLESADSLHTVVHEKYIPPEVLAMRVGVITK